MPITITTTSAAVASSAVAVLWFFLFIIFNYFSASSIVYLRCFTANAKNIVESADSSQNIASSIKETNTISSVCPRPGGSRVFTS